MGLQRARTPRTSAVRRRPAYEAELRARKTIMAVPGLAPAEFGSEPESIAPASEPEAHEEKAGLVEGKLGKNFQASGGLADNLTACPDARPQSVEEKGFLVGDEDARVSPRAVPRAPLLPFSRAGDLHRRQV